MEYKFLGYETAGDVKPLENCGYKLDSLLDLYNVLAEGVWREATCAPRMQSKWSDENKTLGQCSITAFLVQDIFGGEVYGIKRPDGNFHCYNVIGDCVFDLTSEQFGDEKLDYTNNPEQFREVHFAKEEKYQRFLAYAESIYSQLDDPILSFSRNTFHLQSVSCF